MSNRNNKLSVFISLVLRHKPEAANIKLDGQGYALVDDLLEGVNATGRTITLADLKEIVETDNKGRYSFNADGSKIRANQGHSVKVDVGLTLIDPPEFLYHGTSINNIADIRKAGILKMNRLHVHLSGDVDTAKSVGKRHGKPVVLKIDSKQMGIDGSKFYISENGVYLVDYIDAKYIMCEL